MTRKYERYTDEFKPNTLEMAARDKVSIAQLERDLGTTPGLIYRFRDHFSAQETETAVCREALEIVTLFQ